MSEKPIAVVVEDEVPIAILLRKLLSKNYDVMLCEKASEARDIMRQLSAERRQPALLVTDYGLADTQPSGQVKHYDHRDINTGFDILHEADIVFPDTPKMVISGHSEAVRERFEKAGRDDIKIFNKADIPAILAHFALLQNPFRKPASPTESIMPRSLNDRVSEPQSYGGAEQERKDSLGPKGIAT